MKAGSFLFCSLLHCQHIELCMAHGREEREKKTQKNSIEIKIGYLKGSRVRIKIQDSRVNKCNACLIP